MPLGVSVSFETNGLTSIISESQDRTASAASLRKGIKLINKAAKAFAPKKLKHLYRAQGTKTVKGKKGKTVSFAVQGSKSKYVKFARAGRRATVSNRRIRPALYDHLVIGGTRPHSIRKGSRLAQKRRKKFTAEIGQGVGKPHPGAKPNKYRERAYNSVKAEVGEVILAEYGRRVQIMFAKAESKLKGKR